MLKTCVIDNKIHDQLHTPGLYLGYEGFHVLEVSILFVNVFIIPDIISHIVLWRIIYGREPDQINTQVLEIVKP